MNTLKLEEKDGNGEVVSTRWVNTDQIASVTSEDSRVVIVMSNGDCFVAPKEALGELGLN